MNKCIKGLWLSRYSLLKIGNAPEQLITKQNYFNTCVRFVDHRDKLIDDKLIYNSQ